MLKGLGVQTGGLMPSDGVAVLSFVVSDNIVWQMLAYVKYFGEFCMNIVRDNKL